MAITSQKNRPRSQIKRSKKYGQLIETAEDLFFRYGIKRVTIEEICQKANVSKMTFYRYFKNKIDLVEHISNVWLERGSQKLDEVESMDAPFEARLRTMLQYRLEMMARMSTEFIEELMHLDFYATMQQNWVQRIMQFIVNAQNQGYIRQEVRPEFILMMFNKLREVSEDEHIKGLYSNYVEFSREIFNFMYYGILTTRKPENLI